MPERQPLDPRVREFLDEQAASAPNYPALSAPDRVEAHRSALVKALHGRESIPGLPNQVQAREVSLNHAPPARLYRPHGARGALPLLVYLHGGGWVAGSLETVDPFCRLLCAAAEIGILSVDYRQPPEARFPAALEDTVRAVRAAARHTGELQADPERLALGGDSAGGNLAAAAANRLAGTADAPRLAALVLLYPVLDHPEGANHPSYEENASGYGLTAESMRWFWRQYAPEGAGDDPEVSPLRCDSTPALPPTLVTTAEYDVLRDEGAAYAAKLKAAGVATTHLHAPDMHHDFPVSPATVARFPQSQTTLSEVAGWLRAMLAPGSLRFIAREH